MTKTQQQNDDFVTLEYLYYKFKGTGFEKMPIKILLPKQDYRSETLLRKRSVSSMIYGENLTKIELCRLQKYDALVINLI